MNKQCNKSSHESLALSTFTRLSKASIQLRRKVYSGIANASLTESQVNVLELLLQSGPISQKEIAKNLSVTGGNITMVVDNLERRKLVVRTRWNLDRRVIHVALTKEGQEIIETYYPCHLKKIEKALKILSSNEQEELIALCDKLGSHLSAG